MAKKYIRGLIVLFGVSAAALLPRPARAQAPLLSDMMLDCAMHATGGPWIPKELRSDLQLRFSYFRELPSRKNSPRADNGFDSGASNDDRLFVIFWNAPRTEGKFLRFAIRQPGPRIWLTVTSQGRVTNDGGKARVEIEPGGATIGKDDKKRLLTLAYEPGGTIDVREIKNTRVVCDALVDVAHLGPNHKAAGPQ